MEEQVKSQPETVEVVDIQFRPGQKVYYFSPAGLSCKAGDHVIIDTARGPEYGTCTAGNHRIRQAEVVSPLREVIRIATDHDDAIAAENKLKEGRAFQLCMEKVEEFALDMQLVSAEYAFDGSKVLFFFTADERVDFRDLVKSLASALHTRIELRQIGVRDKAKMVGGLGICGRPFCCASFLDDFQPVSIKMAKTQNLSLSPSKISGTCGRLMCCLKYEQEAYEDLIRTSPKNESFVDTVDGRGTVVEVDLLRQRVKVRMEDQPEVIGTYANADIAVLRNGKAKKTDPPIPADLAPISGAAKARPKKQETEESQPRVLDSIRFRYSTEQLVEEQSIEPVEEAPAPAPKEGRPNRNRRGRRGGKSQGRASDEQKKETKPQADKPTPQAGQKQPGKQAEAPAEEGQKKPHHHRRRPPRRRPKGPQGAEGKPQE